MRRSKKRAARHDVQVVTPWVWRIKAPWRLPRSGRLPGGDRIPAHDGKLAHVLQFTLNFPMRVVCRCSAGRDPRSMGRVLLEPLGADEDPVAFKKWTRFSLACTRMTEPAIEAPSSLELTYGRSFEAENLTQVRIPVFTKRGKELTHTRFLDRAPNPGTVCATVVFCWTGLTFGTRASAPTPRMEADHFDVKLEAGAVDPEASDLDI